MARKSARIPAGTGGLIRYFDEYEDTFKFDPKWLIGAVMGLIILEVILHIYGIGLIAG